MARKRARVKASNVLNVLVLAAGQGTRMRSKKIKLLHNVAGRPMVSWVLDSAAALKPSRLITVVGFQADAVRDALAETDSRFVLQKDQRGTGHAALQAAGSIERGRGTTLLILNGDLPTLRASTLRKVVAGHRRTGAALTLVTTRVQDPGGYGRIVRDSRSEVERIVEHRDATREQRAIREINCGIYCADAGKLLSELKRLRPDNAQGEYYITDAVHQLIARGAKVHAICHDDADEVLGVNTRGELAHATASLYSQKAADLQKSGVTVLDGSRTWVDPRARIGRDSVLYPDVIVEGSTVIGEDCRVMPGCRLVDCRIGRGVEIKDHSVLIEAKVGAGASVGPFAHLRPGSVLDADTKVGNFVELKKTRLGRGSKASHLTYLGDSVIGTDCNIGAGTITCNYDGVHKHTTKLGRGVFIGSDSQLVAPVTVEDGAYVAAGTTVTGDVPRGSLAIGRSRQRNVLGWVAKQKKKKKK